MKNISILLALVCMSCAPIYLPNSRNVPMFSKAREFQGGISLGSGCNAQAAVALTNNLALTVNGMIASRRQGMVRNASSFSLWEGGIGFYRNTADHLYMDIFGGFGQGRSYASDSVFVIYPTISGRDKYISSGDFNRLFVQPSFGWKAKHFHGAVAHRFSLINFTKAENLGKSVAIGGTAVFFEPAFSAKFLFKKATLLLQAGVCTPISKDLYFNYIPITVSVGMGIYLGY